MIAFCNIFSFLPWQLHILKNIQRINLGTPPLHTDYKAAALIPFFGDFPNAQKNITPCFSSSNEDFQVWPMHLSLQNWKWAEDAHREGSQGKRSWNPFPTKLSLETHLIFPPSPCNITSLPEQIVPLCIKSDSTSIHLRWKLAKTGRVERLMGDSTGKVKYVKQKMKILNTKENAKSRIITNKWKQSWIKRDIAEFLKLLASRRQAIGSPRCSFLILVPHIVPKTIFKV